MTDREPDQPRRAVTKIDKSKQLRADQLLCFKHQVGLDLEVIDWLKFRREYFEIRDNANKSETLVSEIKYRSPFFWRQELKKEYIPGFSKTMIRPPKLIKTTGINSEQETALQKFENKVQDRSRYSDMELLLEAVCARHTRFLELAFEAGIDFNTTIDKYNRTVLHQAAYTGDLRKVIYIVEHGGNTRAIDAKGKTPLHLAIQSLPEAFQMLRITQYLIDSKSDVNAQDDNGWTPLHVACVVGDSRFVRQLLLANADVFILNNNQKLAINLAKQVPIRVFNTLVFF